MMNKNHYMLIVGLIALFVALSIMIGITATMVFSLFMGGIVSVFVATIKLILK